MIIGIDVGGTFTDGVLVDGTRIVATRKKPTTLDIKSLIDELMCPEVKAIHVGTTHAINALLERKGLAKVGLIRIAGHRPDFVPYVDGIDLHIETIGGGFECDGRPITPYCSKEAQEALDRLVELGVERIAVVGTFASLYPAQELAVAALSPLPTTMSHQLGGIGIIERENAAVLNAALQPLFEKGFASLKGIFLTQNNGSLFSLEEAVKLPVLTLSAGPANSFMGASHLANCSDATIVDIGGTSSDIGTIENGAVKRSFRLSEIAGVPLSLPMPDLISLAIGGGSVLHNNHIGPQSVGLNGKAFGGTCLTLTDAALIAGTVQIEGADLSKIPLTRDQAYAYLQKAASAILAKVKNDKPLFLVGGGAILFPKEMWKGGQVLPMASIANAYGAALAQRGGTIDKIAPLSEKTKLEEETIARAIARGAAPAKVRIIQSDISPLAYDSLKRARMVITAMG